MFVYSEQSLLKIENVDSVTHKAETVGKKAYDAAEYVKNVFESGRNWDFQAKKGGTAGLAGKNKREIGF